MIILNILQQNDLNDEIMIISGSKSDEDITRKIKYIEEPQLQIVEIKNPKKENKLPFPFI